MSAPKLSYIERERFAFIESRLYWRGRVRREDVRKRFELSEASANLAFRNFIEARPGVMTHVHSVKSYVAAPDFSPEFYVPDIADCELERVDVTVPVPGIERSTLDGLAQALRDGRALRIEHLSRKGEKTTRVIEPLVLITLPPPFQHLLYAYCQLRGAGRTFALSHIKVCGLGAKIERQQPVKLDSGAVTVPVGAVLPPKLRVAVQTAFGAKEVVITVPHSALHPLADTIISTPELRDPETEAAFQALLRRLEKQFKR